MKWTFLISSLALAGSAWCAERIYSPVQSIADQGISVRSWGSGIISETDELAFQGGHSVRVSTRNFFQGGKMSFAKPIDLSTSFADKNNLLMFTIKLPDAGSGSSATSGGSGNPQGFSGQDGRGGESRGGGGRGAAPGPPGGGKGRGGSGAAQPTADPAALKTLRLVLTTSDGKKSEVYVPVSGASGENGWRQVGVPLQSITGLAGSNKTIKEIALAGNSTGTFWIGEIGVLNDSTPLSVDVNVTDLNLALLDEVDLIANGYGGASILRYTWDFDAKDGIQIDAEGPVIKRKFRKPGEFTVTVTVSDAYGLKAPASRTFKVVVNP